MPSPATTAGGTAATQDTKESGSALAAVPFIRASQLHREFGNVDKSLQITGSDQDLGVFEVPAYGYLANIVLVVEATGGASTPAVVFAENSPFNALKQIYLEEPNGAVISQFKSGYELFLANKFGGYGWVDPRATSKGFSTSTTVGNFSYVLKIPVQLRKRDGLGSLPNQNSSAQFRLRATLAKSSEIYTTAPGTTLPTVRVRAYIEAWDQPSDSAQGRLNNVTPPAVNTTQYWSSQEYSVVSGENTIQLKRVGNYIRNLILVFNETSQTRANSEADIPDPLKLHYDARILDLVNNRVYLDQIVDRYKLDPTAAIDAAGGRENAVRPYDFCHEFDGTVGNENNDLWLETLTSTRLELQGSWGAAGTLTVLTNDVSVAGNVFM